MIDKILGGIAAALILALVLILPALVEAYLF